MELPKELTTITTTSKIIAGIVFITLPFIAFFIGTTYQASVTPKSTDNNIVPTPKTSTSSATADATADWKEFSSLECGISIKYPSGWVVKDSSSSVAENPGYNVPCFNVNSPDYKIIPQSDSYAGTSIVVRRTLKGVTYKSPFKNTSTVVNTLEDYIKAENSSVEIRDGGSNKEIDLIKDVVDKTYGMQTGKYYISIAFETESNFIFSNDNYLYNINWPRDYNGEYKNQVDLIISTLKLNDQTTSTADWKTYINTKNGYSLQYPNSLELVKGPGANLPDEEFQKLDNISFGGMQKSGDTNAGVVFGIEVNPQDANGKPIQCSTNDECLQKWMGVLNKTANQGSYINKIIMGKNIKGFEYQNKNSLYTQTNQYFVYPEGNKIWLVSLTTNNYTTAEVATTFDQILSTFKFT